MRVADVVATTTALLDPFGQARVQTGGNNPSCDFSAVLKYVDALPPIPRSCVRRLKEKATVVCSKVLGIEDVTIYTTTITPEATQIVLAFTTTETTSTNSWTTIIETTETDSDIATEYITTTRTIAKTLPPKIPEIAAGPTIVVPEPQTITAEPVAVVTDAPFQAHLEKRIETPRPPSCYDIADGILSMHHPGEIFSEACRCLRIYQRTYLTAATAAEVTVVVTNIATVTSLVVETDVQTSVSVTVKSETTTTTETITETETALVDRCSVGYKNAGSGNGIGNTVQVEDGPVSQEECCLLCETTPNCVALAFIAKGNCQLLVKTQPLADAPTSEHCPLGIEAYKFGIPVPRYGLVFRGPCADPSS